jgi:hypothetical protein
MGKGMTFGGKSLHILHNVGPRARVARARGLPEHHRCLILTLYKLGNYLNRASMMCEQHNAGRAVRYADVGLNHRFH